MAERATAAELRRAQRLGRAAAGAASGAAVVAATAGAEGVASAPSPAAIAEPGPDVAGVHVDPRDGVFLLAKGARLPRDAPRSRVRWGKRTYFDLPNGKAARGRSQIEITKVVGHPGLGAALLASIEANGIDKSYQWWRRNVEAATLIVRTAAGLGQGIEPGSLPRDFVSLVEALFLRKQGRKELSETGEWVINDCRRLLRWMPGAEHVDARRVVIVKTQKGDEDVEKGALDEASLERLVKRCMLEIGDIRSRKAQVDAFIERGEVLKGPLGPDLLAAAAWMRRCFPLEPPGRRQLRADDSATFARLNALGWMAVKRAAYPMAEDMVPFAALLGLYTRLNASVLAGLRFDTFNVVGELGHGIGHFDLGNEGEDGTEADPARLVGEPYKPRAGRGQRVDFPVTRDQDNPAVLIDFILDWTRDLRDRAGVRAEDLFLFVSRRDEPALSFNQLNHQALADQLAKLSERAGIRRITPRELRPIGVDIIHDATGGDRMMIKAAGWWRDVGTAERHYLGPAARKREEEDLAWAKILEARRQKHRIDVSSRPGGADRCAATPGFTCYDPFGGPYPQPPGELCRAIGHCAICPNSDVDEMSPWACAQLVALSVRIERMAEEIAPDAWSERFEPIQLSLLDDWLPLFPQHVADEAASGPLVEFPDFIFHGQDDGDD